MTQNALTTDEMDEIHAVTNEAIDRGIDHAEQRWRNMADEALFFIAKNNHTFTVNDVRAITERSPIKTHDKRAMGGVIRRGMKNGWIKKTGEEIPSKQGHGVAIQIWESVIFQNSSATTHFPSKRETFGQYTVIRRENGSRSCNCPGYRFRKTCSHIEKSESLDQQSSLQF